MTEDFLEQLRTQKKRDCRVDPCDLCVKRANGEPCEPGCLGFRVGYERGSLVPCPVCGLDDGEVHARVNRLLGKHPPEKKNHPSDECNRLCRGWDVFEANREHFEIERNDTCGVFETDDDAFTAACRFFLKECGAKYELLVDDVKNWKRCVKCDAPISKCGAFDGDEDGVADRCVECADDHVMPWQKNEPEWPCDCCGNETADVVPSVDYDNSLAEELQCVLCEPCWKRLRDIPFEEAKTKLRKLWRTARNYERNDER